MLRGREQLDSGALLANSGLVNDSEQLLFARRIYQWWFLIRPAFRECPRLHSGLDATASLLRNYSHLLSIVRRLSASCTSGEMYVYCLQGVPDLSVQFDKLITLNWKHKAKIFLVGA